MGTTTIAGWHGKLPSLGDFATRRLPPDFVSTWDGWLSAGLDALQQQPGWLDAYLASPSWRFLLMPGVLPSALGEQPWAGVLMPSVDRVGRYYPLTLAAPLPALPADSAGVETLWTWLLKLDEAAADALHEDWPIARLEEELLRLPVPTLATPPASLTPPSDGIRTLPTNGHPHAGAVLQAQAAAAWQLQAQGRAYWSAHPEHGAARLLSSPGLADRNLVAHLMGAAA